MEKTPNTPNTPNTPDTPDTPGPTGSPESDTSEPGLRDTFAKRGETSLKAFHKTMDDFKKCRSNNEVDKDIQFLIDRKKDFGSKGWTAEQFERITSNGLVTDRWLGNIPGKDGRIPFRVANVFMAKNSEDTTYDDVVNKIDYAISLDIPSMKEPIYIGFDVTLDEGALEDKLLRTTTDPNKNGPFGFSGLDYCYQQDGTMLPKISNVPRYCITMDLTKETATAYNQRHDYLMQKGENIDKKRADESQMFLKRFNNRARFIVLSEVYEQNKLYQAMLPPQNGKDNLIIEDAKTKLEAIDKKLLPALYIAAKHCPIDLSIPASMGSKEKLSESDHEAIAVMEKRDEILKEIKGLTEEIKGLVQKIKDPATSNLDKSQKKQLVDAKKQIVNEKKLELCILISNYVKTQDSHYLAFMEEINRLSQLEQSGAIEKLKKIGPRNKTISTKQ